MMCKDRGCAMVNLKQSALYTRGWLIKRAFAVLGFGEFRTFYNVCKSVKPALNSFELIRFYNCHVLSEQLCDALEAIAEKVKTE